MEEKLLDLNSTEAETKQENEKLQKVKKTLKNLMTLCVGNTQVADSSMNV